MRFVIGSLRYLGFLHCLILGSVIVLAGLVGCGASAPRPSLNRQAANPSAPIALSQRLTVQDFRKVFAALNDKGRLDGISRFLDAYSDTELEEMAGLVSKYFYEDTAGKKDLVSIIEKRIQEKSFSRQQANFSKWVGSNHYKNLILVATEFLSYSKASQLMFFGADFIHPGWTDSINNAYANTTKNYHESRSWPQTPWPTGKLLWSDITRLLNERSFNNRLLPALWVAHKHDLYKGVLDAIQAFHLRFGAKGFEGASYTLATQPAEQLSSFFEFVKYSNHPTQGLFKIVEEKIRDKPESIETLIETFQPFLATAASGFSREFIRQRIAPEKQKNFFGSLCTRGPKQEPSQAFQDLSKLLRDSLTAIERPTAGRHSEWGHVVNAYVLASWLEAVCKDNQAMWNQMAIEDFANAVWQREIKLVNFQVDLLDPNLPRLSQTTRSDWEQMGWAGWVRDIDDAIQRKDSAVGMLRYDIPAAPQKLTLGQAFREAFRDCHQIRPIGNLTSFFRVFLYFLSRPEEGLPLSLSSFETENLLTSLNQWVSSVSLIQWNRIAKFLFEDLAIGKLSDNMREQILGFYDQAPSLIPRMNALMDHVQSVYGFHASIGKGFASPFDLYHEILSSMPRKHIGIVSDILGFGADTGVFANDPVTKSWRYPAFIAILKQGRPLAKTLHFFSEIKKLNTFISPFRRLFDEGGREVLSDMAEVSRLVFAKQGEPISNILEEGIGNSGLNIEPAEQNWLYNLIRDKDHAPIIQLFAKAGPARLVAVVKDLQKMQQDGTIREIMLLLGQMQNDRLQKIAKLALDWDKSGELAAWLAILDAAVSAWPASAGK